MSQPETWDRSALLALTPVKYLHNGFRDETGEIWPDLLGVFATAVATQLEAAEVSLQELAATLEAFRQVLPLYEGTSAEKFSAVGDEALETVSMMYRQPNNRGIVKWLEQCYSAVKTEEDITAFLKHFLAVVRQYSIIISLKTS